MADGKNIILSEESIRQKVGRMAWQIYEDHAGEKEIILAGILDRGSVLARMIAKILEQISPIKITLIEIRLDRKDPRKVDLSSKMDFSGLTIILVDDVANSGRTLLYAVQPFLEFLPAAIRTAVLIDRRHKSFPITPDYSGYSLSTTLQDNIVVDMKAERILQAYLE